MKQLPYLVQIAIVAVVIILSAVGAYFFMLQPLEKANQADTLTLKGKQAEIAQLMPYKAKLAELTAQTAVLKIQMEAQKQIVPEEKEVPSLITQVERESIAAGVEVRRYTPKPTTKKEYYIEVPFEIDVDGPYFSVVNFYDRLHRLQRIINVSNLTLGSLKGGKTGVRGGYPWAPNETVGANCVLTTFYSTPVPAAPGVPVKK